MFSIKCGINQAIYFLNIKKIIVITNTIHAAKCIFDSLTHLYQLQFIAVSLDLRTFFNKSTDNSITFWDCPSSVKWPLYSTVDKETKYFKIDSIFPCKFSWNFSRKEKCNSIL